jgi:hypothetical protein
LPKLIDKHDAEVLNAVLQQLIKITSQPLMSSFLNGMEGGDLKNNVWFDERRRSNPRLQPESR